jgi:hypothetical protein
VDPSMAHKAVTSYEAFIAYFTSERFLSCVDAIVYH